MEILVVLLVASLLAVLVWVLTTQLPMPPGYRTAIQAIVLILIVLWVLSRYVEVPGLLHR